MDAARQFDCAIDVGLGIDEAAQLHHALEGLDVDFHRFQGGFVEDRRLDLGGDDVLLKTVEEQKAGAFTGDVWFSSGGADLIGQVLPSGYVWRFVPDSTAAYTPEQYQEPLLFSRFGTSIFAYNSELEETCPISNIWELTQPEWKGRFFIEDPLNDASTLSKLITIASKADVMKEAYVALYGTEPVLDADTPDAGWLWLKKFAQNGPTAEPGGDEVDSAFATPGMTDSYMALTSYSNMADVVEGNLAFEPCWGIKPMLGVQSQSYIGIINQALDEFLAEQEGEYDTDTRWALAWYEQYGFNEGPFGVAGRGLGRPRRTAETGLALVKVSPYTLAIPTPTRNQEAPRAAPPSSPTTAPRPCACRLMCACPKA